MNNFNGILCIVIFQTSNTKRRAVSGRQLCVLFSICCNPVQCIFVLCYICYTKDCINFGYINITDSFNIIYKRYVAIANKTVFNKITSK